MSQWASFVRKGKLAEKLFAQRHLSDIKWANSEQDKYEHWDMEGGLNGKTSKFDVKEMKKINRWDPKPQDVWPGLKEPTTGAMKAGSKDLQTILFLNAKSHGSW